MRFILRILGTWALGIALVLLTKDIIISAVTKSITLSSLAQTWVDIDGPSFIGASETIVNLLGSEFTNVVFSLPAWIFLLFLGVVFLLLGKKKQGFIR